VAASSISPNIEWKFGDDESAKAIRIKPRLTVTSNDGAIAAVRHGGGITRLLSYQVAGLLQTGELKTVLGEFEPKPLPIHIVHREGRHGSAKIRAFVDFMAQALKENSALN
jgi:DNA-binding transcriptional LysR family regulator